MERYTSEQVRALLCEGCKHGLSVRAERRESERLRMAAKRARRT